MSKEKLYIDDGELVYYINENEFIACDEIPMPMLEEIKHLQQKVEQLEKEIDRLNNIINRIDSFVDRTIEIVKQQPTGDDEWILERLNEIKYLIELKENNK